MKIVTLRWTSGKTIAGLLLAALSLVLCFSCSMFLGGILFAAGFLIQAPFQLQTSRKLCNALLTVWALAASVLVMFGSQYMFEQERITPDQKLLLYMSILLVLIAYVLLFAFTLRIRLSVLVSSVALLLFATIDYYVIQFRGVEIAPSDLYSIKTAMNVAGNYSFSLAKECVLPWFSFLLFAYLGFLLQPERIESRRILLRIAAAVLCVLMVFTFARETKYTMPSHTFQNASIPTKGVFISFITQFKEALVHEPKNYSTDAVSACADPYSPARAGEPDELPDIIVIMNESFSDLSALGSEPKTNQPVLPFFRSLSERSVHGWALSSVFGGSTPNSEFEFLTGHSMGLMPMGACPYMQYLREPTYSMVSYLESLGYSSLAMHPYDASGWARFRVYPDSLGFDESRFLEDFPQRELVREYVSDREMYEEIVRQLEKERTQPLFLFGVTMQNHGGYDYADYENTIRLEGYAQDYPLAEQYLSLMNESDHALEYLISYLEQSDRKVVLCLFGDHMPRIETAFMAELHGSPLETLDEQQLMYTVPFVIWTNDGYEEKSVALTSLNYLSTYVYEAAGIELPAYNQFLADMEKVVPCMNANGWYSREKNGFLSYYDEPADAAEGEWLEKYSILQYNGLFDKENKSSFFFPD